MASAIHRMRDLWLALVVWLVGSGAGIHEMQLHVPTTPRPLPHRTHHKRCSRRRSQPTSKYSRQRVVRRGQYQRRRHHHYQQQPRTLRH